MSNSVANETLAYCSSCKMDLAHAVVAMKGDQIVKVHCKTCNKDHKYKAPKGITEPKKEKKTKKQEAADQALASHEAEWKKLLLANKAPFKNYSTKTNFDLGDKIQHPNFGEGIVGRLIYPNKIEVLFQKELKVLLHGGQKQV